MMSTWTGAWGLTSWKARQRSSSWTIRAGIWRSIIFWKMLSGIMAVLLPGCGSLVEYPAERNPATARSDGMPWLIGMDEAGYGPNLGPFVMSAVACKVPEGPAGL